MIPALADSGVMLAVKLTLTPLGGVAREYCERDRIIPGAIPRLVQVSDLAEDSDDLQRVAMAIEQKGPYTGSSGTIYQRFEEYCRAEPIEEADAVIGLRYNNGQSITTRTLVVGKVATVRHTQTISHIEIEPRRALTKVKAPQKLIDNDLFSSDTYRDVIPEESRGQSLTMPFGDPFPYICPLYRNTTARTLLTQRLIRYGLIPPQGMPTIEFQRETIHSTFAFGESFGGTELDLPVSAAEQSTTNPISAWAFVSALNGWAQVWALVNETEGGIAVETLPFEHAFVAKIARQPYMVGAKRCAKFVAAESDTITDPKFAIDGKQETYATITNAANDWCSWEVSPVSGLGHICANTVDRGTAGGGVSNNNFEGQAPAGLQVYAILCFPSSTLPSSGSITIALKFPGATADTAFGETAYNVSALTFAGMAAQYTCAVIVHNLRLADPSTGATGNAGDGWFGTKWGRGDITSVIDPVGSDALLGQDLPLIHAATREVLPMRAAIKSTLNQPVGIVDVGMRFGFINEALIDTIKITGALSKAASMGFDITSNGGRRRRGR